MMDPKMWESQQLFLGLRLVSKIFERKPTIRNPNQNIGALRRIFSTNKSVKKIGRKDSQQTVIPTSRRLD
jgi:hypothetical protein